MKKFLAGVLLTLAVVMIFRTCTRGEGDKARLEEESALLQMQLDQVGKLVVTEGHFSEVFTYADTRELFGPLLSAEKKALVVINAKATVSYDIRALEYRLEPDTKTLYLEKIPEPELEIYPDIQYYDVSADYFNPFGAEDYNAIKEKVQRIIRSKVEQSGLREGARERLISELADFQVVTRSLGWKLVWSDGLLEAWPLPRLPGE